MTMWKKADTKKSKTTLFFCATMYYFWGMKASEKYIKQKQAERAGKDKYIGSKERFAAANNAYGKWLAAGQETPKQTNNDVQ